MKGVINILKLVVKYGAVVMVVVDIIQYATDKLENVSIKKGLTEKEVETKEIS